MRRNIKNNYGNINIRPPQTSRNYNVYSTQQNRFNQPNSSNIQTSELSLQNQIEKSGLNDQVTDQQNIQSQEMQETHNPSQETNLSNVINNSEDFSLRLKNDTNRLKGMASTSRTNYDNISVPNLMNKNNNYKNISRNVGKNIKFNINEDQNRNNIRNRLIDTSKEKNHTRAKSYFTERKNMSNYLPKQEESKKRLSHSFEVKRKTIVRGDKYQNIQITHIISSSKPNLSKYNFHITEQLSTMELNQKSLDLTKIKLYIKKDPTAKSFYNSSCRNAPIKSAEKILKTTFYQHAGGRGMTNLKSSNINSKFYQSGIVKLPLKVTKKPPSIKIIDEFRSELPMSKRNASLGEKYNNTYTFNNKTFNGLNTQRTNKPMNQENTEYQYQKLKDKENEEKNKLSGINYNNQNKIKNILPLTSRGNAYTSKTYTNNNRYINNNTYKTNEDKQRIIVNVNSRPNKNFYTNTQNQSLNINNTSKQITTPSYKNNINVRLNKLPVKSENENLGEQPLNTNSGRKDILKNDIEKPKFINKLPLTNINNITYNRNINNIANEETPKKIEQNVSYNIDSGRKPNLNKIEVNKVENKTKISNIKPSINTRNINTHKNIIISNINQNKSPSTNYVNNRNDNKYKNSNRNNIVSSSQTPVIHQNFQRPQPQLSNISTSSIKKPEVKIDENKIQKSSIINQDKNEINSETKNKKEENKNDNIKKTQYNIINTNTNINKTPNNIINNIKVNNNFANKYKNSNAKINNKPEERKVNSINTTKYTSNTINSKIPSRNEVKSSVNISQNIPATDNKNNNAQEKPKYKCITYSRPTQNMTNITHYINKINNKNNESNKKEYINKLPKKSDNNIINNVKQEIDLEKPETKNQEIIKIDEKEKLENNNIESNENAEPQKIEINLEEKKEDSQKPEEKNETKNNKIIIKEENNLEVKDEKPKEKIEEIKYEIKDEKPIEKAEEIKQEKKDEKPIEIKEELGIKR